MHLAGFVAFYVEGNLQQPAYGLYSPDGGCQHQLGRIQVDPNLSFSSMTMMLLDKKILACGQAHATDCYLYDVGSDTWTVTTGPGALYTTQGVVLHQKMYLPDEYSPKVFDSATKKWSNWAKGGTDTYVSCYVAWEDYIFKFGGYPPHDERYDPADDTWSFVTTSPPFPIYLSGCVVLANDNILITGSGMEEWFYRAHTEYNVTSGIWSPVIYGQVDHQYSTAILLGSRVFVFPGVYTGTIEEYNYSNRSLSTCAPRLTMVTDGHPSVIAVPATWFSHLPGGCTGVH